MAAVDIASILNQRSDDIKEPMPLPVGTYLLMIDGFPQFPEDGVGKNHTPAAILTCKYLAAQDDVSPGDVAEAGGLEGKTIRHTLWLSKDAQFMSLQFARDTLGVDIENKSLKQIFSEFPNKQFYAQVGHRPAADGSRVFNEIKSTSAA